MFEAHNFSAEEFEELYKPALCWQRIYSRTHKCSLRPLKIWFAEGRKKGKDRLLYSTRFVYIEYQDNLGNNFSHSLELTITGQSVEQVLSEVERIPISAFL